MDRLDNTRAVAIREAADKTRNLNVLMLP